MVVSEIPYNSNITINVKQNNKSISFQTKIFFPKIEPEITAIARCKASIKTPTCVAEAIIVNGKTLGLLKENGITYSVTAIIDNKPYTWTNVTFHLFQTQPFIGSDGKQKSLYLLSISSEQNIGSSNRRDSYRVSVLKNGTGSIGLADSFPIVVLDISNNGIGFTIDKNQNIDIKKNDTVILDFNDEDFVFKASAFVVRTEDKGKVNLYGCKLKSASNNLRKYIAKKQRKKNSISK